MNQILALLLPLVLLYGYPIIILVILAGAVGLPIPVSSILMIAGSLTIDNTLNLVILIPLAAITAVIGDCIGYWFGVKCEKYFTTPYFHRIGLTEKKINSLHHFLEKWGVWFIFFSRWLITPLGIPLNVVAGVVKYPFLRFLLFVILGETIWATLYVYLGFLFSANWVTLITYINNAPWILALILLGICLFSISGKMRKKTSRY